MVGCAEVGVVGVERGVDWGGGVAIGVVYVPAVSVGVMVGCVRVVFVVEVVMVGSVGEKWFFVGVTLIVVGVERGGGRGVIFVGRGFVIDGDSIGKNAIFKNCSDFSRFAGVGWGNKRGGGWCNGCGEVLVSACGGGVVVGWCVGRDVGIGFIFFIGVVVDGGCIVADALLKYCSDLAGCGFSESDGGAKQ